MKLKLDYSLGMALHSDKPERWPEHATLVVKHDDHDDYDDEPLV